MLLILPRFFRSQVSNDRLVYECLYIRPRVARIGGDFEYLISTETESKSCSEPFYASSGPALGTFKRWCLYFLYFVLKTSVGEEKSLQGYKGIAALGMSRRKIIMYARCFV